MRVCKKNVASYRFELQPVKCQKRNGQSGNPPNPPNFKVVVACVTLSAASFKFFATWQH